MVTKFQRIAEKYTPAGLRVRWKRSGRVTPAEMDGETMLVPRPVDAHSLQVYLHECAHYSLGHRHKGMNENLTMAHEEYQAERWSLMIMRQEGIPVPRKVLVLAKENVRDLLTKETKRGDPYGVTPAYVRRWAK